MNMSNTTPGIIDTTEIFRATHEPVEEVQPAPEWVSMCARCRTEHGPFVSDHGTTVCEVCIGKIVEEE